MNTEHKMRVEEIADTMPAILDKLATGAMVSLTAEDIRTLHDALEIVQKEHDRLGRVGRPRKWATDDERKKYWQRNRKR